MPTNSRKEEGDHCWMKATRCRSTPSYWLFRVATTSLHISCISIIGCTVWLEKTCTYLCFHKIQRVIGLINSNTTWDLTLIGVEWILPIMEKETSCAFITKVIPSSWCSYLSTGLVVIINIYFPSWLCLALGIIAIGAQSLAVFDGSLDSSIECVRSILLHLGTLHN